MKPDTEDVERTLEGTAGERLLHLLESSGSSQDGSSGPYLLVDLGEVFSYLRAGTDDQGIVEGAASELSPERDDDRGRGVSKLVGLGVVLGASYAARRLLSSDVESPELDSWTPDPGDVVEGRDGRDETTEDTDVGRSTFRNVLVVGAVVAVGYALVSRFRSTTEPIDETAERTESAAREAASTIQRRGELVAERIESGSEAVAERVESGGEATAERMTEVSESVEEAADTAEDVKEEAEDTAEDVQEETADTAEDVREEAEDTAEDVRDEAGEALDDATDEE